MFSQLWESEVVSVGIAAAGALAAESCTHICEDVLRKVEILIYMVVLS